MDHTTHKRITLAACEVAGVRGDLAVALSDASVAPDLVADRELEFYVTRSGHLRTRARRVIHHGTPFRVLKRLALGARRVWIRGDEARAVGRLGRLLHYVHDNAVVGPKLGGVHDHVESSCSRMDPRSFAGRVSPPVGKRETLRAIREGMSPSANPHAAMETAVRQSIRVVGAILSPSSPPAPLLGKGEEACRKIAAEKPALALLATVFLLFPLPVMLWGEILSRILVAPSACFGILLLAIALARSTGTTLRLSRVVGKGAATTGVGVVVYFALGAPPPVLVLGGLAVAVWVGGFLRIREWREVSPEVDWFRWHGLDRGRRGD